MIEALFLKIDKAIAAFEQIQQQLTLYQRAVLKAAVCGHLSVSVPEDAPVASSLDKIKQYQERFSAANRRKFKSFLPIALNKVPFEIPEHWVWVPLRSLVLPCGSMSYQANGLNVPSLKVVELRKSALDDFQLKFSSQQDLSNPLLLRGDLLFYSEHRSSYHNRCTVFQGRASHYASHNFIRFRLPLPLVSPYFIAAALNVLYDERWLQKLGQSTATIRESQLLNLAIPLPPIEEQSRIVDILQQYFETVERVTSWLAEHSTTLALLKKSLLNQIFKGNP